MMDKSVRAYLMGLAALALPSAAAAAVGGALWIAAVSGAVAVLWWSLYFLRLRYSRSENMLCIESGLVFRRKRVVYEENILWVTKLTLLRSRRAVASVLHTAGGWIVIFSDFSTLR